MHLESRPVHKRLQADAALVMLDRVALGERVFLARVHRQSRLRDVRAAAHVADVVARARRVLCRVRGHAVGERRAVGADAAAEVGRALRVARAAVGDVLPHHAAGLRPAAVRTRPQPGEIGRHRQPAALRVVLAARERHQRSEFGVAGVRAPQVRQRAHAARLLPAHGAGEHDGADGRPVARRGRRAPSTLQGRRAVVQPLHVTQHRRRVHEHAAAFSARRLAATPTLNAGFGPSPFGRARRCVRERYRERVVG